MFAQQFAARFEAMFAREGLKLTIHDPRLMTWWAAGPHQAASTQFNAAWAQQFQMNARMTFAEAWQYSNQLAIEYNLPLFW